MKLRAGQFEYVFPRPALVMGIVNVTPDSFSDGGRFLDPGAAADRAFGLADEGAELIDIGGESTRPGSEPVSEREELRRVLPVLERLAGRLTIPISIDTQKVGVARAALAAGASLVNDVGANRQDPAMWELVGTAGAGYVLMHMQGTPQTMHLAPRYTDVVAEVGDFFRARLEAVERSGVGFEQVILDVGIGFGKGLEHNLELIAHLDAFKNYQRPLLLGVSRKSFLGRLVRAEVDERLPAGLACASWAVAAGVQLIRTHDVAPTVQAVRMMEGILAHRNAC